MNSWNYQFFCALLDQFLGSQDLTDPKVVKRRQILQAATELFIYHGYRKTSVSDVASHAGVAKGTVYLYFKNKSEMLTHAIAEEKSHYIERLRPILEAGLTPRERLRQYLILVLSMGSQMPLTSKILGGDKEFIAAMFEYTDTHRDEGWEEMQEGFIQYLLNEALERDDFPKTEIFDRAKVILVLPYLSVASSNERILRGLSNERFAELLATMIVDGIDASITT